MHQNTKKKLFMPQKKKNDCFINDRFSLDCSEDSIYYSAVSNRPSEEPHTMPKKIQPNVKA